MGHVDGFSNNILGSAGKLSIFLSAGNIHWEVGRELLKWL